MSQPWIKFYPRDWRGDQALKACSGCARGVWIEMICIMHEATPYGHLVINGVPVTNDVLARVSGLSQDEISASLIELETAGVFSRTRKGIIYSRRMMNDRKRSEIGRKSVNRRYSQVAETKAENGLPSRSPNRKPTTQKPEARSQREANASPRANDDGFKLVEFSADLCRDAGVPLPDHGTAERNRQTVEAWIAAGADTALIRETVTKRCANLRTSPRSLAFFDKPIADAVAQRKAAASTLSETTGALVDRILGRSAA